MDQGDGRPFGRGRTVDERQAVHDDDVGAVRKAARLDDLNAPASALERADDVPVIQISTGYVAKAARHDQRRRV